MSVLKIFPFNDPMPPGKLDSRFIASVLMWLRRFPTSSCSSWNSLHGIFVSGWAWWMNWYNHWPLRTTTMCFAVKSQELTTFRIASGSRTDHTLTTHVGIGIQWLVLTAFWISSRLRTDLSVTTHPSSGIECFALTTGCIRRSPVQHIIATHKLCCVEITQALTS